MHPPAKLVIPLPIKGVTPVDAPPPPLLSMDRPLFMPPPADPILRPPPSGKPAAAAGAATGVLVAEGPPRNSFLGRGLPSSVAAPPTGERNRRGALAGTGVGAAASEPKHLAAEVGAGGSMAVSAEPDGMAKEVWLILPPEGTPTAAVA
jgi:hypothetical protein